MCSKPLKMEKFIRKFSDDPKPWFLVATLKLLTNREELLGRYRRPLLILTQRPWRVFAFRLFMDPVALETLFFASVISTRSLETAHPRPGDARHRNGNWRDRHGRGLGKDTCCISSVCVLRDALER